MKPEDQTTDSETTPPSGDEQHDPEQNVGANANGGDESETERLVQEIADLKDRYMRAVAVMDNMRRRTERERTELMKFGLENVFRDFLPVVDSLERALPDDGAAPAAEGSSSASYYDGMLMVKKQLLEVVRRHGLEAIESRGAPFDPNVHQAIQRVESPEVKVETVGDEYARGYMLNGRLLRPSMVSVLTPSGARS